MQGQIEKSSNLQKPDGAQVSISPTESMTLRDVEQGSRKNSLPSNTIPSENNHDEKADNLEEPKEESNITDMTFPEGGWRAWTVVFGVSLFIYHIQAFLTLSLPHSVSPSFLRMARLPV